MEIQEILDEISVIFRDVLKNNDIVLKEETVASDVQGWDSLTNSNPGDPQSDHKEQYIKVSGKTTTCQQ
ncbi:hypothetical protein [Butyricimonas synergistica]|uniref:hypothetical protein n=1 Tax=Butyricimonas synergistica TaxID=544644 RepID=UPI00037C1B16|nr:hypothetical protein [Butyricimonas synergistica]